MLFYCTNTNTFVNAGIFKDISKSAIDATTGVIKKIPDVIPSPEDLFQSAKNVVAGYPFDVAAAAINTFCKYYI